jgi:hypothetical protein
MEQDEELVEDAESEEVESEEEDSEGGSLILSINAKPCCSGL